MPDACNDIWVCEDEEQLDNELWGHVIELPNARVYQPAVQGESLEAVAALYDYVVVFSGSREIWCTRTIYRCLESCMREFEKARTLIVVGGAAGVDGVCLEWARENGWPHWVENADWNGLGRGAGMIRNRKMANVATHIGVFWDGYSPGSKGMINACVSLSQERGVGYFIVRMPITWRDYHAVCKSHED